ncbi:hypothetical protein [Sphingomonas sp.]|uniref:hypothetical protein n=1 Tax=Sphingomonas sp. TaxID=28214 RepID=UPI0035BC1AA7
MIAALLIAAVAGGQLRIVERADPISDAKSVYAIVGGGNEYLAMGCDNVAERSSIRVVVHYNRYIGNNQPGLILGGTDVQYRFDQRPPETVRWYSHDREVTSETDRTDPIKFIIAMKGSSTVFIRSANFDADAVDVRFSYSTPDAIVDDMLVRCGFNPDGSDPSKLKKKRR